MKTVTNLIVLLSGITLLIASNWSSIVEKHFPYNLPFCLMGGWITGWYLCEVLFRKENK